MIVKSKSRLPLVATDRETVYPVLPLMTSVLFPGVLVTIQVGRPDNLILLDECFRKRTQFVAAYSQTGFEARGDQPIHQVGVFAEVRDIREGIGNSKLVTLEGVSRAALGRITAREPYLQATADAVEPLPYVRKVIQEKIVEVTAVVSEITQLDPTYSPELSNVLQMNVGDPSLLADHVAATFHFSLSAKQELLEEIALEERYNLLLHRLNGELNRAATVLSIQEKVKKQIEEDQQKYFLRQQLHEIRKQLGEDFSEEKEIARAICAYETPDGFTLVKATLPQGGGRLALFEYHFFQKIVLRELPADTTINEILFSQMIVTYKHELITLLEGLMNIRNMKIVGQGYVDVDRRKVLYISTAFDYDNSPVDGLFSVITSSAGQRSVLIMAIAPRGLYQRAATEAFLKKVRFEK